MAEPEAPAEVYAFQVGYAVPVTAPEGAPAFSRHLIMRWSPITRFTSSLRAQAEINQLLSLIINTFVS